MRNINCKLPNIDTLDDNLFIHFKGKTPISFITIGVSWMLAFGHYIANINQIWTLLILLIFFVYTIIPIKWYMKKTYRFFIGSFIGLLLSSIVTYYTGWLMFIDLKIGIEISSIVISAITLYILIFILEFYLQRKKINKYKVLLKSSLKTYNGEEIFLIEKWIKNLINFSLEGEDGITLKIFFILTVPVIVVGLLGGSPLVTAKIFFNQGLDSIIYLISFLGLIALGVLFISATIKELYKVIAFITL